MPDLKEQVLSLPDAEKREIYHALQLALTDDPIPEPLIRVLDERRNQYRSGEMSAAPAEEVFGRLLEKFSTSETEDR